MLWRPSTDEAPSLRSAVHAATGRWKIEQDYRELKDELGLDHFEGRGWLGWHHHVTLVSLVFGFLRSEQARAKKNYQLRGEFHGGRVDKRWLSLPALTILLRQQS